MSEGKKEDADSISPEEAWDLPVNKIPDKIRELQKENKKLKNKIKELKNKIKELENGIYPLK